MSLLARRRYPEVVEAFDWGSLWTLMDGDRTRLNIAHECVDRWVDRGTALRLQFADGRREEWSFADLAAWSSRFAHLLERQGVARGDRVALLLEPSLPFYGALFGILKRGAVAVPLFTLFGPDALRARLEDSKARVLLTGADADPIVETLPGLAVWRLDETLLARLAAEPATYRHWRLEIAPPVATLTMAVTPDAGLRDDYELKLNSYDLAVDIELHDAVQRLRFEHPEVRVVVVTGGLDKIFCAGANIQMLAGASHAHKVNFCKFTNETRNAIEQASAESGQVWIARWDSARMTAPVTPAPLPSSLTN